MVKLLGAGRVRRSSRPGGDPPGHFGLAVNDYTHSTAPNRRYPDLITQRLVKAALRRPAVALLRRRARGSSPRHCTQQEDAANKVERQVRKSAAALLLQNRIGETLRRRGHRRLRERAPGCAPAAHPTVEGRLERGFEGLDVGDRVRVRLVSTDVERGFIDFVREDHG